MSKTIISTIIVSLIAVGFLVLPGVYASTSPSTQPASMQTFSVGSTGGTFTAYGVAVSIPAGLELFIPSNNTLVKVNGFSILQWATGETGPGPSNFPPGTIGVKAFGFMINGRYTFNLGSTPSEIFTLNGGSTAYKLQISIQTNGNTFWIWNPVTGAFTNVTAKTGYVTSNGLATAGVVSPVFAWVITTPLR
jgi:hypothetical protein